MNHFRLPTLDDLKTLMHPDKRRDLFGETRRFWSSSPYASNASYAWFVNFYNGHVYWGDEHNVKQVRLVRADSALAIDTAIELDAPDRLVDNGDGTHTDRHTGLVWRSQPEDGEFTWDAAMAAFPAVPPMKVDWSALGPPIQWGH